MGCVGTDGGSQARLAVSGGIKLALRSGGDSTVVKLVVCNVIRTNRILQIELG